MPDEIQIPRIVVEILANKVLEEIRRREQEKLETEKSA